MDFAACLSLSKQGDVVWLDIDLARPHKATEAAEYVLSHEARLDILGA